MGSEMCIRDSLGPDLSARISDYCKLHGESPDVVLRQAAREHIRRVAIEDATVEDILAARMDALRARYDDDSNAI